jgi:hypothetical protein
MGAIACLRVHPVRAAAIVLGAAAALLSVRSPAADQPFAERPAYRAGDVFEYVENFESIACKRWEVKGHDTDGTLLSACDDNVAHFAADTGALLRIVGKGSRDLVTFEPSAPAMPFPLHVGSAWQGKYRLSTSRDIVSPDLDESCVVTAFETVAVAAGNLPAFRFECETTWSVWPLHGNVTETGWYAPAAKVLVKVVNSSDPKWNLELARYSLK